MIARNYGLSFFKCLLREKIREGEEFSVRESARQRKTFTLKLRLPGARRRVKNDEYLFTLFLFSDVCSRNTSVTHLYLPACLCVSVLHLTPYPEHIYQLQLEVSTVENHSNM